MKQRKLFTFPTAFVYFQSALVPFVTCCSIWGVFVVGPVLRDAKHHTLNWLMQGVGVPCAFLSPVFAYLTVVADPGVLEPKPHNPFPRSDYISSDACKVCAAERGAGNCLRAHHCRVCDHCVAEFDHHCGVVGVCIGRGNRKHFINLLSFGALGLNLLFCGAMTSVLALGSSDSPPRILMLNIPLLMTFSVSFAMAFFALFHLCLLAACTTTHGFNQYCRENTGPNSISTLNTEDSHTIALPGAQSQEMKLIVLTAVAVVEIALAFWLFKVQCVRAAVLLLLLVVLLLRVLFSLFLFFFPFFSLFSFLSLFHSLIQLQ